MFLNARPHITVFGIEIYYYAIIIVSGIAVAISLFAHFLKKMDMIHTMQLTMQL